MRHDLWVSIRNITKQLDGIVKYESGALDQDQTIVLFQALIDSGLAWSLPGNYGRTASELISMGVCTSIKKLLRNGVLSQ